MLDSDVESIVHLTSLTSKLLTKSDKLLNIPKIDFSQDSTEYSTEVARNSVDSRLSEKAELECLKTQIKMTRKSDVNWFHHKNKLRKCIVSKRKNTFQIHNSSLQVRRHRCRHAVSLLKIGDHLTDSKPVQMEIRKLERRTKTIKTEINTSGSDDIHRGYCPMFAWFRCTVLANPPQICLFYRQNQF